jgi:hypothetical protein
MEIAMNIESRHEMVPLLRGLQLLYADETRRTMAIELVRNDVLAGASSRRGRKGLDIWSIVVLAAARLALNLDYDALQDLAENHRNLRAMMGLGDWADAAGRKMDWRRIRDTVCQIRPETLEQISTLVVELGHQIVPEAAKAVRIDSFVMATNVHYPTDIRQVGDALRCLIRHGERLADIIGSSLLRQHEHLQRRVRRLVLIASRASGSKGRGREHRLEIAVRDLVDFAFERCTQAMVLLDQAKPRLAELDDMERSSALAETSRIMWFLSALAQVAEVARRRHVDHEDVPLSDRLFSVFEAHTELIVRGKVPVPVEFGHRILVAEDAAGFILHAHVMANGRQDRDVAPTIVRLLKRNHPDLESVSFDRGFHSPANQDRIAAMLETACIPSTGVHASAEQVEAASKAWHEARRRHPGIESAINALQAGNGCERCRDRTKLGYRRYLALAVLGRNLLTLGRLAIAKESPEALAGRTKRREAA